MWEVARYPEVTASGDLVVRPEAPTLSWVCLAHEAAVTFERAFGQPVVLARPDSFIFGARALAVIFNDQTAVAVEVCDEALWWEREITGREIDEDQIQRYPIEDVYVLAER